MTLQDTVSIDFLLGLTNLKNLTIGIFTPYVYDFSRLKRDSKLKYLEVRLYVPMYSPNASFHGIDKISFGGMFLPWLLMVPEKQPKEKPVSGAEIFSLSLFYYQNFIDYNYYGEYEMKKIRAVIGRKFFNPVPQTGVYTIKYKNGNILFEGEFKNKLPHGKWMFYDVVGRLVSARTYIDGVADGYWYTEFIPGLSIDGSKPSYGKSAYGYQKFDKGILLEQGWYYNHIESCNPEPELPYCTDSIVQIDYFDSTSHVLSQKVIKVYDEKGGLVYDAFANYNFTLPFYSDHFDYPTENIEAGEEHIYGFRGGRARDFYGRYIKNPFTSPLDIYRYDENRKLIKEFNR